jgi:uncharacterized cupredoxin-like copper-binding protein
MIVRKHTLALAAALALTGTAALAGPGAQGHGHGDEYAFGREGDPSKPARVVEVTMLEGDGTMLFEPDLVEVAQGEQIRFVLANAGALEHEFVIGTVEENRKHAEMMMKFPEMEHDDPNARRLHAEHHGELVWQFTEAGTFEFACLIPGHLDAGMRGTIVVR